MNASLFLMRLHGSKALQQGGPVYLEAMRLRTEME